MSSLRGFTDVIPSRDDIRTAFGWFLTDDIASSDVIRLFFLLDVLWFGCDYTDDIPQRDVIRNFL